MNESLNDKAMSTLAIMQSVELLMRGINDYGEMTGFCSDEEQLVNDFHSMLGSIRARAARLERRLTLYRQSVSANTKVQP